MTTTFETPTVLSNIMRTMPYTMYIATGSYAIIFGSTDAGWFFLGQASNECVVHALKKILRVVAGRNHAIVRRPTGAADSGIYPQHHPTASTSSGMPSGHSQMSAFAAAVLSHEVWVDAGCEHLLCTRRPVEAAIASVAFLWIIALLVMTSRTRHGGPLAVRVYGKVVAQHTLLQVIVGAAFGSCLGEAAAEWHRSRPVGLWVGTAFVVFLLTVIAVKMDSGHARRTSNEPVPWGGAKSGGEADSDSSSNRSPKGADRPDASRRSDEGLLFQSCDGIELQSMVMLPDSFEPGRTEGVGPEKI